MKFQSVARSSVYQEVARQIREAILTRALPSGEALPPERQLAEQFGVSRATIREALRQLQAQGLLTPGARTSPLRTAKAGDAEARFRESLAHVVQLRGVSIADLVEMRIAVESASLRRAAAMARPEALDEARASLAVMAHTRTTMAEYHEADVAFHLALAAASGNDALYLVLQAVKDSMKGHLADAFQSAQPFARVREKLTDEHRAILRAVERGNGAAAARLLVEHLTFYGT